ncbi:MAG: recombinase A [Candidatus Krumholzibacteriia bacterium]
MAHPALDSIARDLGGILTHPAFTRLGAPAEQPASRPSWSPAELVGRLCEVTPGAASAVLTAALALVRQAQQAGEPAAWICGGDPFYPPDAAAGGVDLAALPVIRVPDAAAAGRAADLLLRSGAFGLVVLDLAQVGDERLGRVRGRGPGRGRAHPVGARLSLALQGRLVQLALKHGAAVVCLTAAAADTATDLPSTGVRDLGASSLGSLVSLRVEARRMRLDDGRFACEVEAVKDKRRGPGWRWREVCRGPDGLL